MLSPSAAPETAPTAKAEVLPPDPAPTGATPTTGLAPVSPPEAVLGDEELAGADAFANALERVGRPRTTLLDLVGAFLRLQVIDDEHDRMSKRHRGEIGEHLHEIGALIMESFGRRIAQAHRDDDPELASYYARVSNLLHQQLSRESTDRVRDTDREINEGLDPRGSPENDPERDPIEGEGEGEGAEENPEQLKAAEAARGSVVKNVKSFVDNSRAIGTQSWRG
ncbi:MAG: hypothetical protein AAFX94_00240 [Myxococcota bacterium]